MTTPMAISAPPGDADDWNAINWQKVTRDVRRLQTRIAKATREGKWGKVKSLQWLLTHSRAARLLAVRHVTTSKGRNTPGVDGVVWRRPEEKVQAVASLKRRGYLPLSLRRHCIPKKNGKMRALGIPTIKDRAMPALYSYALLPVAETMADPHSYGFRPLRACRDAIQQCYIIFARKGAAEWVLDADIKACFDRISHQWLKDHIPIDRKMLTLWLESGYLDNGHWFETAEGTPQGGVISPLLANLTLDGLQQLVRAACPARSKVNFVRYADDFIVTASSRELLETRVLPALRSFLDARGLHLSEEKTRIVHITEGFDFLGQTVRRFKDKLLIQPAKGNLKTQPSHRSMKLTLSRTLPYGSTFGGVVHLVEFDLGARHRSENRGRPTGSAAQRQRARQGAVFREDNRVAVGITTGHGHLSAGIHTNQKGLPVKPIKSTMTVLKQVAELIPAYANRNRNADMAEELFWGTLADLQSQAPTSAWDATTWASPGCSLYCEQSCGTGWTCTAYSISVGQHQTHLPYERAPDKRGYLGLIQLPWDSRRDEDLEMSKHGGARSVRNPCSNGCGNPSSGQLMG